MRVNRLEPFERGRENQPETFWEIQKRLFIGVGRSNKEFGELLIRICARITVKPYTQAEMLEYLKLRAQGKSQLEAASKFENIRSASQRIDRAAMRIFSVERAEMLVELRRQDRTG